MNERETHIVPTPDVGGWDEPKRNAHAAAIRADLERAGWTVVEQRRDRNRVFDKSGQKTTFVFIVERAA